jgi:hypothetical protein
MTLRIDFGERPLSSSTPTRSTTSAPDRFHRPRAKERGEMHAHLAPTFFRVDALRARRSAYVR